MSFHNWALTTSKTPTLCHRPLPARQSSSHRSRYLCLICALGPFRSFAISITGAKPSGKYLHTASFQIHLLCMTLGGHMGCKVAQDKDTHEASAPRGPVWDGTLLQGTAAATSSAISQAFDDKNSLFQQQARSKNIVQFPVSVSFIS